MAPPQYGDLGKSAKDIFNKGYSKRNARIFTHYTLTFSIIPNQTMA